MDGFRFKYVDLLHDPYGLQYFEPIEDALLFAIERFPNAPSWRSDIARYLTLTDRYIDQAIAKDQVSVYNCPREFQVCRMFYEIWRTGWRKISKDLEALKLQAMHDLRSRGGFLEAAVALRQCERCIATAKAGDTVGVGFLVGDLATVRHEEQMNFEAAVASHEASLRGKKAASASHARDRDNKFAARAWYREHQPMTKDAAAQKMHDDGIVHASFRTIRGYLTNE